MTTRLPHFTQAIAGVILLGAMAPCAAQSGGEGEKDVIIRQLKRQLQKSQTQYQTLARDLVASKKREAALNKRLNDLRLRFAALGDNLLNGGEEAMLEAVKNAQVLEKRNSTLQKAAFKLLADMHEYLRTAIAADPDARVRLETSIRELDVALGIRQNPRPHIASGNLQQAKIVSIDSQSGVLIINAGETQSVRRGMTFAIMRGDRKIADAIVADTRKNFSGVLPTKLDNPQDTIRVGDTATVKTTTR